MGEGDRAVVDSEKAEPWAMISYFFCHSVILMHCPCSIQMSSLLQIIFHLQHPHLKKCFWRIKDSRCGSSDFTAIRNNAMKLKAKANALKDMPHDR